MNEIKGNFPMKFIGKPDGKLMKGAPGNYEHGKVYVLPFRHSRRKFWELQEPVPEFVAPEPSDEDSIFEDAEDDGVVFVGVELGEEPITSINIDPEAPAMIEPYMTYSPSTETLSAYVPPPEEPEEKLEEEEIVENPPLKRKDLQKILDDAGVEYKPKTRTVTLQKMVDGLAAEE